MGIGIGGRLHRVEAIGIGGRLHRVEALGWRHAQGVFRSGVGAPLSASRGASLGDAGSAGGQAARGRHRSMPYALAVSTRRRPAHLCASSRRQPKHSRARGEPEKERPGKEVREGGARERGCRGGPSTGDGGSKRRRGGRWNSPRLRIRDRVAWARSAQVRSFLSSGKLQYIEGIFSYTEPLRSQRFQPK
jgi:hypothetical protein